jgi:hypothetical protein
MAMSHTHLPMMDWTTADHAESFLLFKQKLQLYLEDEDITEKKGICRKLCLGIGDEGL